MSNKNVRTVDFSDINDIKAARKEMYADVVRGMKVACAQLAACEGDDSQESHKAFIGVLLSVGMNCESACRNLAKAMSRLAVAQYVEGGGPMPTTPEAALELAKRLFPTGPLAPVEQPGVSRFNGELTPDSSSN